MRPHGSAKIDARNPRALAVCDRCGRLTNLNRLQWQFDWNQGPRLFNLRILVCDQGCLDVPQESGRTIHLPPDPIGVMNARPEAYASADNPASYLGFNVANLSTPVMPQSLSGNIGNMTLNGGVDAAFDGNAAKRAPMSAALSVSISSFQNWVGKNWNADTSGMTTIQPSTAPIVTHNVSSALVNAPIDAPFLNSGATGYHLDVSSDGVSWTTVSSGTTAGTIGETLSIATNTGSFQYHRIVLQGDGISTVAIAQAVFNISDQAPNDI
jgi:hypothetical protein